MFDDDDDLNEETGMNEDNSDDDITPEESTENLSEKSNPVEFENFDNNISEETQKAPEEVKEEEEEEKEEKPDPNTVTVQPVQFASFEDLDQMQGPQNQNLNILLDVKLQLSVELGKAELPIKKVLELTKGSIVTLNKAAGEPVELYANGKLIAYGEVVVIEDNFGLRITHITDPVKRLNTINGGARED